jgi:hypothetical protein
MPQRCGELKLAPARLRTRLGNPNCELPPPGHLSGRLDERDRIVYPQNMIGDPAKLERESADSAAHIERTCSPAKVDW